MDTLERMPPHRVFYGVGTLDNVTNNLNSAIDLVRNSWIKVRNSLIKTNKEKIYGDQYKIEIAKSNISGFKPHINVLLVVSRSTYIGSKQLKKMWHKYLPGRIAGFKSSELKSSKDWEAVKNYIEKPQSILYDNSLTYEVIEAIRSKQLMNYSGNMAIEVAIVDADFQRNKFLNKYPNLSNPDIFKSDMII